MRRKRDRQALWALAIIVLLMGGWLVWSRGMPAFANRYRSHLPPVLLAWVLTPLPTALPAPAQAAPPPRITIPALSDAAPTPVSLPATFTPLPALTDSARPLVTPTAPPVPTPTLAPTPTITPTPLPAAGLITGLQVVPQHFNNCGPANLSIVLNFYGRLVDQDEAGAWLKPNNLDRNVNVWEMQDYVDTQTLLAADVYYGANLEMLRRFLAAGFPVIVEKGYEPNDDAWMGHYLTLFGYDDARQVFLGMDTFLGPWNSQGREASYETLMTDWQHFNYTALVVYRPEKRAQVREIAGTSHTDPLLMWQNAALLAQTELQTDPDNAFAWFNLGSSLTALARLADDPLPYHLQAAAAFDQARDRGLPFRMLWYQFTPYEAYLGASRPQDVFVLAEATLSTEGGQTVEETYLYQGLAWLQQGDTVAARAAYSTALSLNPRFTAASDALAHLNSGE